jgi:hypothetical protein
MIVYWHGLSIESKLSRRKSNEIAIWVSKDLTKYTSKLHIIGLSFLLLFEAVYAIQSFLINLFLRGVPVGVASHPPTVTVFSAVTVFSVVLQAVTVKIRTTSVVVR